MFFKNIVSFFFLILLIIGNWSNDLIHTNILDKLYQRSGIISSILSIAWGEQVVTILPIDNSKSQSYISFNFSKYFFSEDQQNIIGLILHFNFLAYLEVSHIFISNNFNPIKKTNIDFINIGMLFSKGIIANSFMSKLYGKKYFYRSIPGEKSSQDNTKNLEVYGFANCYSSRNKKSGILLVKVVDECIESFQIIDSLFSKKQLDFIKKIFNVNENNKQSSSTKLYSYSLGYIMENLGTPVYYFSFSNGKIMMVFMDEYFCHHGHKSVILMKFFFNNKHMSYYNKLMNLSYCHICYNIDGFNEVTMGFNKNPNFIKREQKYLLNKSKMLQKQSSTLNNKKEFIKK